MSDEDDLDIPNGEVIGANGQILAAAPRMLELLEELFSDVHAGRMACKDNATVMSIRDAIAQARAAATKLINESKPLDPEFSAVVDREFWNLLR